MFLLPWVWRLGPSDSSERQHVQEMLEHENFPENTIFCGDAGFVGCEFWKAIMDRGCHFLIRGGSNVKLIQTDDEGYVLSWPKDKQDDNQPIRTAIAVTTAYRLGPTSTVALASTPIEQTERAPPKGRGVAEAECMQSRLAQYRINKSKCDFLKLIFLFAGLIENYVRRKISGCFAVARPQSFVLGTTFWWIHWNVHAA